MEEAKKTEHEEAKKTEHEEAKQELTKEKCRNVNVLLYPDDPTHMIAFERITKYYDHACILHDRDYWTEKDEKKNPEHKAGTLKKPHYHLVVKVSKNGRWTTAIAKELGIKTNYLENCSNFKGSLLYLIHKNHEEKAQYSIDDVQGNLKEELQKYIDEEEIPKEQLMNDLIEYIMFSPDKVTYAEFMLFCINNGSMDLALRASGWFSNIIREHNTMIDMRSAKNNKTE